jgi:hypothetical protein
MPDMPSVVSLPIRQNFVEMGNKSRANRYKLTGRMEKLQPQGEPMLELADIGFYLFHTLLIGFNMLGWIWRGTRFWHLIAMSLTTFSWFVMGAYYGWGYCLCTAWHFQIRDKLGYHDTETTYLQLLAEHGAGITISRYASDVLAVSVFCLILLAMAIIWGRDLYHRRAVRLQDLRLPG